MTEKSTIEVKYQFKCILLGNSGTGKTSILNMYLTGKHDDNLMATIGATFSVKCIETENGLVRLDIWDTAGQERFESLMPLYYKKSDVAIIVYEIISKESLAKAKYWIERVKNEAIASPTFILVGNKNDLYNKHNGTYKQIRHDAKEYALNNDIMHITASAKTGLNINLIFESGATIHAMKKNEMDNINNNNDNNDNNSKIIILTDDTIIGKQINTCYNSFKSGIESGINAGINIGSNTGSFVSNVTKSAYDIITKPLSLITGKGTDNKE